MRIAVAWFVTVTSLFIFSTAGYLLLHSNPALLSSSISNLPPSLARVLDDVSLPLMVLLYVGSIVDMGLAKIVMRLIHSRLLA